MADHFPRPSGGQLQMETGTMTRRSTPSLHTRNDMTVGWVVYEDIRFGQRQETNQAPSSPSAHGATHRLGQSNGPRPSNQVEVVPPPRSLTP